MTKDVTIKNISGERFAVGYVPSVEDLRKLSVEDLVCELEARIQKAAERAYRAGYEDFCEDINRLADSNKRRLTLVG